MERALILNRGETLSFNNLRVTLKPELGYEHGIGSVLHPEIQSGDSLALDAIVSGHIRQVLTMTGGKVGN